MRGKLFIVWNLSRNIHNILKYFRNIFEVINLVVKWHFRSYINSTKEGELILQTVYSTITLLFYIVYDLVYLRVNYWFTERE